MAADGRMLLAEARTQRCALAFCCRPPAGTHSCASGYSLFEESARVPFILATPGMKTAGQRSESLIELTDVEFFPGIDGQIQTLIDRQSRRRDFLNHKTDVEFSSILEGNFFSSGSSWWLGGFRRHRFILYDTPEDFIDLSTDVGVLEGPERRSVRWVSLHA
jgi:hypothetical protein